MDKRELWARAAVAGGLWASVEVIVGSFLHNTRIPFAGSILAFTGTVLLLGFYTIWPYKGFIWRAGLVTAIMKSVSPSAIILGPMTGILLEAFLIEFVLFLFGKNPVSYMTAGVLSISSALFHKIISLLIYYGFNLIEIYVNLINFGLKQMGLPETNEWKILAFLLIFYLIAGITAGLLGYFTGTKALRLQMENQNINAGKISKNEQDFFTIDPHFKTCMALVFIHLFAVVLGLSLFNYVSLETTALVTVPYILISGYRYRSSLRRLKKPVFWSQLVVIVFLSAFFWDKENLFTFSRQGFMVGIEMILRAMFIVVAFSSLSVELKNEKVRTFLYNIGFGAFYRAIEMAFSALPGMISLLPDSKEIIKSPVTSFLKPLIMADYWLHSFFRQEHTRKMH